MRRVSDSVASGVPLTSLWIFSRQKQTGHFATVRETGIGFRVMNGDKVPAAYRPH